MNSIALSISMGNHRARQSLRYGYRIEVHPGDFQSADIAGLLAKYTAKS